MNRGYICHLEKNMDSTELGHEEGDPKPNKGRMTWAWPCGVTNWEGLIVTSKLKAEIAFNFVVIFWNVKPCSGTMHSHINKPKA